MSIWNKVQNLNPQAIQKINTLYGDHFPIEIRYVLAQWIEDRVGNPEIDLDNPTHEIYIAQFLEDLIKEIELKANAMINDDPYFLRIKLLGAVSNFKQKYSHDPVSLFRFLRHCLDMELTCINQQEMGGLLAHQVDDSSAEINDKLGFIQNKTRETTELLRRMEQEQEAFAIKCHERQKLEGLIYLHKTNATAAPQQTQQALQFERNYNQQKERIDAELRQKLTDLMRLKTEFEEKITGTVKELSVLQAKVLDEELTRWKREQQLAGNGAPLHNNLDTIQSWCEDLAELIWHNRHQLKEAERLRQTVPVIGQAQVSGIDSRLALLSEKVTQLLSSLVTSTFIVEKQPPQVMKTNTRFVSTVRLLVGGRLNVHMTPPQVKVAIISEAQANSLLRNDKGDKGSETSGEILNNTGTMEYHQGTRHLSVHFRNMQLKRIKRAEKKGTESVMDEKFCLHFQCQFTVGEKELIFKIWTLSLPAVVIVHGNQEPHAWATVTWDNAFGEPGRMPFQVPERVVWYRIAQALNVKFKSMTGRALTEDNLRFLAEKAFRTPGHSDLLTWSQFCKEPLPDKNFTFWEWFYAIMKLTREHLRGPWVDGSIIGFVEKRKAEEMLSQCQPGTFLLRFSDTELGGVTIAWVHLDHQTFNLAPFTGKDLAQRSLADRICDISHINFLYPDIPKSTAFSKYYTPPPDSQPRATRAGYVNAMLVQAIPGIPEGSSYSQPSTPHTYLAPSPDPSTHSQQELNSTSDITEPSFLDMIAMLTDNEVEDMEQFNIDFNISDITDSMGPQFYSQSLTNGFKTERE